ncbi:NAD(P)-dependent dehydrogenase (short-subunit alcohol dehydrogenase family) [Catenuloplanes nepalensis]|uniref:NAD(P)-dependent dehydrogenase (Short-subunit alcohol dehydrogenase family) n=1 Tax=Catenuloplanes nepalensis TaxID=587533 RepID=A0ABT9MTY7_9ACTN|nr:SDR family oxidoreductase [Catenuloplanes nepalensis]MDP9794912.1 NAD(P)-dependent dehydrogenase (short-subunit alcohol dehydrogenase family) [Catenuloplanes nepalensis]
MDLQLSGKTAFISGSSRGIGYAVAKALAAEGVDVVLNGRDPVRLAERVDALRREVPGVSVTGVPADFTLAEDVDRLCDRIPDVDILINNVGLFELKQFGEISDEDWRRYFEVNVLGGVRLARRLLPAMLDRGWGRIVFVSSESGVNIPADMIHYGTSKTAMLSVGNGLAKLTKGTAVTVNSVLGGPTYSDGVADTVRTIAAAQSLPEEQMKAAIIGANQTSLLGRFIEPGEIANAVTFLASPAASAINGAAVRVDGGVLTTLL